MKKIGFTLSEILLTMGIIGIVAAMTAPMIVTNTKDNVSMSRLSSAVSNIENALTTAISREDAGDIYHTDIWGAANVADFSGKLGVYLNTSGYESSTFDNGFYSTGPFYMTSDGGVGSSASSAFPPFFSGAYPLNLKSGAVAFIKPHAQGTKSGSTDSEDATKEDTLALWSIAGAVAVDTTGKAGPNVWGRDIFGFYVGNNGILYPLGGDDVKAFASSLDKICVPSSSGSGANQGGLGCAATVIKAGYKINY